MAEGPGFDYTRVKQIFLFAVTHGLDDCQLRLCRAVLFSTTNKPAMKLTQKITISLSQEVKF